MNQRHLQRPVITGAGRPRGGCILRTSVAFLLIRSSSKQSTLFISSVKAVMGPGAQASSSVDPPPDPAHRMQFMPEVAVDKKRISAGSTSVCSVHVHPKKPLKARCSKLHCIFLVPHQRNMWLNQTVPSSSDQKQPF